MGGKRTHVHDFFCLWYTNFYSKQGMKRIILQCKNLFCCSIMISMENVINYSGCTTFNLLAILFVSHSGQSIASITYTFNLISLRARFGSLYNYLHSMKAVLVTRMRRLQTTTRSSCYYAISESRRIKTMASKAQIKKKKTPRSESRRVSLRLIPKKTSRR